jgi:cytochrome b561
MFGIPASWRDQPSGYGPVTRIFHWSIAVLAAWQFATATLHFVDEEAPLVEALWWTHRATGFAILLLAFLRGAWGLANLRERPPRHAGWLGDAARLGQLALYALMIVVPAVALLRTYANGRGFVWFGVEIIAASGERREQLTDLTNQLHGPLGWVLFALVVGHAAMALVHHFVFRDRTLVRMLSGPSPEPALQLVVEVAPLAQGLSGPPPASTEPDPSDPDTGDGHDEADERQ